MHFRYAWMMNCSILQFICTSGVVVTLLDCFLCSPFQIMLFPNSWDQNKEHTYTAFVKSMIDFHVALKMYIKEFFKLRKTNSNLVIIIYLFEFQKPIVVDTAFNILLLMYCVILLTLHNFVLLFNLITTIKYLLHNWLYFSFMVCYWCYSSVPCTLEYSITHSCHTFQVNISLLVNTKLVSFNTRLNT